MVELTADEKKLLEQYRVMNTSGKERMFEMAEFCLLRYPIKVIPLTVLDKAREKKGK